MSIYGDMTLDEYRDALSSSEPTPVEALRLQ